MSRPPRQRHRSGDPSAVTGRKESRVCAGGASAQTSGSNPEKDSGEQSPGRAGSTGGITTISSFRRPPRCFSGYSSFDGDSLPSSPLPPRRGRADSATQTPSPSGQVMNHALQRMAEAHGGVPGARRPERQHGSPSRPSRTRPPNTAGDMQAETIGQDLRRIGDDYNNLIERRRADRQGQVVMHPNMLPHFRQEPAFLLGVGLLLLLFARMLYLQESTNNHQDHAQV